MNERVQWIVGSIIGSIGLIVAGTVLKIMHDEVKREIKENMEQIIELRIQMEVVKTQVFK